MSKYIIVFSIITVLVGIFWYPIFRIKSDDDEEKQLENLEQITFIAKHNKKTKKENT